MALLSSVTATKGTSSFVRLRFQLAAIEIAEEGLDDFDRADAENAAKQSVTEVVVGLLEEQEILLDHFQCAAYVLGQWQPRSKDDQKVRALSIYGYNQIAAGISDRIAISKRQLDYGLRGKAAPILKDAEKTAASDKMIRAAQSTLVDAMGFSLMLALDLSEPNAKTTPYMTLTCGERAEILRISKKASEASESDYQKVSGLVFQKVSEFKCRQ